jgi:hypothetical protein
MVLSLEVVVRLVQAVRAVQVVKMELQDHLVQAVLLEVLD